MPEDWFSQFEEAPADGGDWFAQFEDSNPEPVTEEPSTPGGATLATGLGIGAARMAPGIVSLVNKMAPVAGKAATMAAKGKIPGLGVRAPAAAAMAAGGQVMRGDFAGAGQTAGGAIALSQAPKAIGIIQRMTEPASRVLPNGVKVALKSGGGALARGAGAISKVAGGPIGVMASAASLTYDMHEALVAQANDPNASPSEREAALRMLNRAVGGSRSR